MRRLVLVRHAKSAWDDPSLADHDRPLAPRGEQALPKIRTHVATLDLPRLLVLCSTANRARATLDGIAPVIPADAAVTHERRVYESDAGGLLDLIRAVDDDFESVMVVGHNPALQDLAVTLVVGGDAIGRDQLSTKLPTGAVVCLSFEAAWSELPARGAILDELFMPRRPRT